MKYMNNIKYFVKNKMVFCGIDIHKHHWNLCYVCDGEVVEKLRIVGNWKILEANTKYHYDSARSVHFVYEAGFSGFYLYRHIKSSGYTCTITPPNRVPSSHDKVKTDKRDAKKLAKYLSAGLLKEVFVPPLSTESNRQLLRVRNGYQKKLTRVKNQIKSHINLYGLQWSSKDGNKWTKRYIAWLEGLDFEETNLRFVMDQYLIEYHFLRDQIAKLTNGIRELSRTKLYREHFQRLVSCKGVGLITAMTFLLELHEIIRFPSTEKFCSYLGLTPSQYSSGDHIHLGHITREGNSHIRRVLVESAWTVIRHDAHLRQKYNRIRVRGANGKKAIVAVARSLAVRLRRCLLDEVPYNVNICKSNTVL